MPMVMFPLASLATATGLARVATHVSNVVPPCWCSTAFASDVLPHPQKTARCPLLQMPPRRKKRTREAKEMARADAAETEVATGVGEMKADPRFVEAEDSHPRDSHSNCQREPHCYRDHQITKREGNKSLKVSTNSISFKTILTKQQQQQQE